MTFSFVAGQILQASDLNNVLPRYLETAGDVVRGNTTTLADDGTLVFNGLTSSATYLVIPKLFYRSTNADDFKIGWRCSGSGATMLWSPKGITAGTTTTNGAEDHSQLTLSDSYTYGGVSSVGSSQTMEPIGRVFVGTGAGIAFAFQWAQGVADGVNGTTLMAGSNITLIRVA